MIKKTFLVTGGTGFIGSEICNRLLKLGYKIIIFDNFSRNKTDLKFDKKNCQIIKGDITLVNELNKCFKNKIHAIIHLAYINGTNSFYKKPVEIINVALKGLINVFDLAIKYKVKELYLASSSEVYHHPKIVPTPENIELKIPDVLNPRFSYSSGKIMTEIMGVNYGRKYFKKLIIFRPHNVYGSKMGDQHVIPEIIKKIKKSKNNNIEIQGTGLQKRSFIYISDFVDSFELLLKKGKHLNIYNIGNSRSVRILDLVKKISKALKKKVKIKFNLKIAKGGTHVRCPDISKITKLGYRQKISLNDGISKIIF